MWNLIQDYLYDYYMDDNFDAEETPLTKKIKGAAAPKGRPKAKTKAKAKAEAKKDQQIESLKQSVTDLRANIKAMAAKGGKKGKSKDTPAPEGKGKKGKGKGKGKDKSSGAPAPADPNRDPTIDRETGKPKKEVLCRRFQMGQCKAGDSCHYHHDENLRQEIAAKAQKVYDGLKPEAKAAAAKSKGKGKGRGRSRSTEPNAKAKAKPKAKGKSRQVSKAGKKSALAAAISSLARASGLRASTSRGIVQADPRSPMDILQRFGLLCSNVANTIVRRFTVGAALHTLLPLLSGFCGDPISAAHHSLAMPAQIKRADRVPAVASSLTNTFTLEHLNDSGAGRTICSRRALEEQGVPSAIINKFARLSTTPTTFETGGGVVLAKDSIGMTSFGMGTCEAYLLPDSPFAKSMGQSVEDDRKPFIWLPGQLPFHVTNAKHQNISCPMKFRAYADRVEDYVPIWKEQVTFHSVEQQKACANIFALPAQDSGVVYDRPPDTSSGSSGTTDPAMPTLIPIDPTTSRALPSSSSAAPPDEIDLANELFESDDEKEGVSFVEPPSPREADGDTV